MIADNRSVAGSSSGTPGGMASSSSTTATQPTAAKSILSSTSSSNAAANLPENLNDLVYLRIHVAEFNLQKCLHFASDTTAWEVKQKLLSTLPSNLDEAFNYGLFSPPFNGKAGKFLDDERTLAQYPLPGGPVGYLELKYKRRVYKMNVEEKTLKTLHSKTSRRKFLEYVQSGNVEKVTKFCDRGLDPNFHTDSSLLCSSASSTSNENETPLTLAAQLKQPQPVMNALVHGGAHLDFRARSDGGTALHRAAQRNNFIALQALLELGASPDYRDAKGLTALYYAVVLACDAHLCERLLHEYASIGVASDSHGWQEVHQACRLGRVKHLEHLIFYGGDELLNSRNINGNTPLHIAAASNQESCVRYLLFRGADKSAQNSAKQNCQQVSILAGNYELAEIIAKHSAGDVVKHCERPSFNPRRRGGRRLINGKPAPPPPSLQQQVDQSNGIYTNHCDIASNISASNKSQQQQQQSITSARDNLPRSVSDINGWVASTAQRVSRRREQQQHQRMHSINNEKSGGSSGVVEGSASPTRLSPSLADEDSVCEDEACGDDDMLSTPSTASRNKNNQQRHRAMVHNASAPANIRHKQGAAVAADYGSESLSSFESSTSHSHLPSKNQQNLSKQQSETNKVNSNKIGQTSPNGEDTSGVVTDKSSCNSDSPQPHLVTAVQIGSNSVAPPNASSQQVKTNGHVPKNSFSSSDSSSSGINIKMHGVDKSFANNFNTSSRPSIGSTNTVIHLNHAAVGNNADTLRPAPPAVVQQQQQQQQRESNSIIQQHMRTIQVRRGSHGFGFVLRGSRSGTGTPQQSTADGLVVIEPPALQYLDEVDDGGPGDLAGLRAGDFLLEINREDVRAYPHERCVNMIRQCRDAVELTVVTLTASVPQTMSAVRLGSQRSMSNNFQPANMSRTASASNASFLAKKAAPAPPRRSPHTSLSANGDQSQSTTDLDDSISTSDSAFLPPSFAGDPTATLQHNQHRRNPSEQHQQNHYETSDRIFLKHSLSMPNGKSLPRSNQQLPQETKARHSSSSSSTANTKQFSSVSQMKRAREKQRRRAAVAAGDVDHHTIRRQSSEIAQPTMFAVADDEIDYYYQHLNNNENQQQRLHRVGASACQPTTMRSKSESRSSHQKRKSKKAAAADDDSTIYYQQHHQYLPPDYDTEEATLRQQLQQQYYQQQQQQRHVGSLSHSQTYHESLIDYGQHPSYDDAAEFALSYQPQPVHPLNSRQNSYNSRTLGYNVHSSAQEHQQHAMQNRHQTQSQHVGAPTMRRTPFSQPNFVDHHQNNGKSFYRTKLDPITGSPLPPTTLLAMTLAAENEPMPDYFDDDEEEGDQLNHHHRNSHQSRENIPPYYSPDSSSARSSQQPSNVSISSYPITSEFDVAATAAPPKGILRSRLPQAPAPPPMPPPGSLQDFMSNSDDAATTLSVSSSLQNQQQQQARLSGSAFTNAISEAAATLSRKRAETTSSGISNGQQGSRAARERADHSSLMAGIANITKPFASIPVGASSAASNASPSAAVVAAAPVQEFDVFQADLKRALERRRNKIQSAE